MECHDARLLLTFAQRKSEVLDPAEQSALQQHLDKCPDCGSLAQADRQADAALSKLMRDVPIPADLKSKIMTRLTTERPGTPWKWLASAAAAIFLMLGITGTLAWRWQGRPAVTSEDIGRIISGAQADEEDIEGRMKEQGLDIKAPHLLDYRYFLHADVVMFRGRRVAKLTFARDDRPVTASVLILPRAQFRMDADNDLHEQNLPGTWIRHSECGGYIYVIFFRGDIGAVTRAASS